MKDEKSRRSRPAGGERGRKEGREREEGGRTTKQGWTEGNDTFRARVILRKGKGYTEALSVKDYREAEEHRYQQQRQRRQRRQR